MCLVKAKFHMLRHVTSSVVRVVMCRDVSCRACCAVLVPAWRTTKKQWRSRAKRYHVLLLFVIVACE